MAKRQPAVSRLTIEEAFTIQDERFVELIRAFHEPKALGLIAEKWARDHRPWARQKIIDYISGPWDSAGHQPLIKRLFKNIEAQRDDELMAVFLHRLDTYVRRLRKRRAQWDFRTRQVTTEEILYTVPHHRMPDGTLFKHKTRYYLRRRAWRYFRKMGFKDQKRYVPAITRALLRYEDAELEKGENILDSWGLIHACFGESEVIEFKPSQARVRAGARLADLKPDPYFPQLWQAPEASESLFRMVESAGSRLVRVWAMELLKRWHREALDNLDPELILGLLDHPDGEVQQFAAELLVASKSLGRLPLEAWLRLLNTQNVTALEMLVGAMEKHVAPERLSLQQLIEMGCARPVPVARLALRFLQQRKIITPEDRATLAGLSNARCEGVSGDLARFALSILGTAENYDPDQIVRFFDSRLLPMRQAAWEWLTPSSPGWNDSRFWSKLIESPYDDVRLKLVAALEHRKLTDVSARTALWGSVLLGIHRGGRIKLMALRQISDAIRSDPASAEQLLPVLAVAIRSVRFPEARGGLCAIVSAVDARPELEPLVARFLPELKLNIQPAGSA